MIIGQLYYYESKLDEIHRRISEGDYENIEVLGITRDDIEKNKSLTPNELLYNLRQTFSKRYNELLQEENMKFAAGFWNELISPVVDPIFEPTIKPSTPYQNSLLEWLNRGNSINEVSEIVFPGLFSNDEEDYALFYGIKTLHTLNLLQDEGKTNRSEKDLEGGSEGEENLSKEPEILVITKGFLAPLFVNINCDYILDKEGSELLEEAEKYAKKNTHLKMVLAINKDRAFENSLKKRLDSNILIATLEIDDISESKGFFDQIVRSTLGINIS